MLKNYQKTLCCLLLICSSQYGIAQSVPDPASHFGFPIGEDYKLATFTQTEAYFKKLAASSNRTKLVNIGLTEEGRDQFMLIISSPENMKHLDRYQQISRQLAHAKGLTPEQAKALASEGKAVVWIDGGLHANETVGIHQLIETAYQLTSRNDEETTGILDHVIVLMTHANPDGQELISNWYMRHKDPLKRTISGVPTLYQKYIGHDNNRDFFMLNMKETQNMGRQLFVEWLPQIMYNHHQAGPAGTVVAGPPYRDPFNYVFDPVLMTSIDAVGAAMHNRMNTEDKPGYTQRNGSVFSTWYNGGLRTTTYFHNMVGLLTEIIGGPTPADIPLVPSRLLPNSDSPNPAQPQKWHFRQSIDYSVSLNYAVLGYARRYSDEILFNTYKMASNSIRRGSTDTWSFSPKKLEAINDAAKNDPALASVNRSGLPVKYYDAVMKDQKLKDARAYIIPADQADITTAVKFLNALIRTGVDVHQANAAFKVNGKNYPKGSYVVKTDQAFRPHVLDMFEPQDHPNDFKYAGGPPVAPYDAAGWTLAYLMNVKFDRIADQLEGPFTLLPNGTLLKAESTEPVKAQAYQLSAAVNDSYVVVNDLLKAGAEVHRSTADGSFYVPAAGKSLEILKSSAAKLGLQLVPAAAKPQQLVRLKPSRIALWDTYGGSMPSGWIRWLMEQYHYQATVVFPQEIDKGNLNSKYDVLVLVGGAVPAAANDGGGNRYQMPEPENLPNEFKDRTGRLSVEKSVPALRAFMEKGGHVVTIGSSTALAYHLGLPVRNALVEMTAAGTERRLPAEKYYIPGSVLRADFDQSSPSNWGMDKAADVYFDNSPVFKIAPEAISGGLIKPLAWFGNPAPLRSGWAWGQAYLQDGVTAFEARVGQGKLLAFGPEITFRAQTHGTFKLLFNQLYL
ncbi:M14 family metallopeptidase [Pedobacter antarcticus]|uniref:M14 family metallopeptidase n=1 Tax=Pedobacter antarcticus TaxID=34086 RepID=UPI002930A2A4|nr:M14 family metallopeptidase [Pedobacter antarcticus]